MILGLIKNLKTDMQVRNAQCNKARENEGFEQICKQEGMGIEFEYSAPVKWKVMLQ